jgi:hypothetical protein
VKLALRLAVLLTALAAWGHAALWAQADEGTLSEREVDSLRDAAYMPVDSMIAYEKILDTREKQIEDLLAKRHYPGREKDLHDLMDQMASIVDELNDHLDKYSAQHRDVRKELPKLVKATERWSTALRAPPDDAAYKVVRRIALDSVKDTRDTAEQMETELEKYFTEHPDAAKAEKERAKHPHDPYATPE